MELERTQSNSKKILKGRGLVKQYGKWTVVNEVSLDVAQGEVVGLLGPNGAGKTTTFYMIVGLLKPDSGSVLIDSENVTETPVFRRARMGIGYLSQEPSIFRKLTVKENILSILQTMHYGREEREKKLQSLMAELGVAHLAERKAYQLSGGERRRVEISRALVSNPSFMLLDEPFVGIDPIAVAEIQEIVSKLKQKGIGVLITDHSVRETLSATDRAYVMFEGRILLSGSAQELANDPLARKMYLGEKFRL
ncbi:MAG: LPS export ABC transporter ATP-binding protein [Candidatus Eisenbacteria bacterium]|nr:LPS export ABC transporter ATP-binding protein [Candidatus Eisenbacteria bacterium]